MISKISRDLLRIPGFLPTIVMGLRGSSLVVKFVLTLFIAKFLSFEALGVYGLISSVSVMVPIFLGLSLMYIQSRKAVTQPLSEIAKSLLYYAKYTVSIYILFAFGALAWGVYADQLVLSFLITLVIFFEHINTDFYTLLLNLSKPFVANILHFLKTAVWMLIYMALAFVDPEFRNIETLLIGWISGGFLCFLGFLWVTKDWPWQESRGTRKPLLKWVADEFKEAKTIYAYNFTNTLGQNIDRFLITYFLGLELTGVYVFFGSVTAAMANLVRTGVIQIARPKMVKAYKDNDPIYVELYKTCLRHTMAISGLLVVLSGPAMAFIAVYMNKPLALEWLPIFGLVLIVFLLVMWMEVNKLVFYSQHRDDLILKISLVIFPLSVVSHIAFILAFGFWGAAISPVVMCILCLMLQYVIIKKLMPVSQGRK